MAKCDDRSMTSVVRSGAAAGFLVVALGSVIGTAHGQTTYYYDNNGTTAGFGSAGNTWGTSTVISTDPTGVAAPANTATSTLDTLNLGTTTDGLGNGNIAISGTRNISSIVRGSASSPGIITLSGGTAINFAAAGSIINNATGQTLTIQTPLTGGSTSMTFMSVNLESVSSYAGATIFSANSAGRILSIANGGINSTLGSSSNAASNLVFNDGANLRYDGGAGSTDRNFTINGSSAAIYARGSGNLTWNGTASFGTPNQAATLNLQNTGAVTGRGIFNGVLADNGTGQLSLTSVSFAAGGSWTLGAANTFTGSTTITSGLLILGNANALQRSYIDTTASATGTATDGLRTTGAALNLGGLSGNKNLASIYTTSTGGYGSVTGITLNVAAANSLDYSGVIDGGRTLTKTGNGTQTLSGANTYTGATTISTGTLQIGNGGTSGSIANTSGVTNNANLIYNRSDALSVGYGISGTGAVTKLGGGTTSFSGTNSYAGTTTISAGTLRVNGTHTGGAVYTVASGATLGGTGSTASALSITGTLAPGASIETFQSGAATFNNTSTFQYEVDSSVPLSSGADLQIVTAPSNTGDLTIANGVSDVVTLTLTDLAGVPTAFSQGTTFTLINYDGTWNGGLFNVGVSEVPDGGTFTVGLNTWQLDYNATSGGSNFSGQYLPSSSFVNIVAVPEPAAVALLACGGGAFAMAIRRRLGRVS